MAACDNLYGNKEQWTLLRDFIRANKPKYLKFMRPEPEHSEGECRICYTAEIQGWLIENCPFDWVREELDKNFTIQTVICGKAHHE